jgi:hypothetical protein
LNPHRPENIRLAAPYRVADRTRGDVMLRGAHGLTPSAARTFLGHPRRGACQVLGLGAFSEARRIMSC